MKSRLNRDSTVWFLCAFSNPAPRLFDVAPKTTALVAVWAAAAHPSGQDVVARATSDLPPCGRHLFAPSTGYKEGSKELMVLQVR